MSQNILFEEKQYLGRNKHWLNIRMVMAAFCFAAYFWTEHRERDGDLLLLVGSGILLISFFLTFLVHFKTTLYQNCLVLDGIWTTRKVKIDLSSIKSVQKTAYSQFLLNNPVYNLHKKGTIRFYTRGKEAVKLTDKDGLVYMIGSQRAEELSKEIRKQLNQAEHH